MVDFSVVDSGAFVTLSDESDGLSEMKIVKDGIALSIAKWNRK